MVGGYTNLLQEQTARDKCNLWRCKPRIVEIEGSAKALPKAVDADDELAYDEDPEVQLSSEEIYTQRPTKTAINTSARVMNSRGTRPTTAMLQRINAVCQRGHRRIPQLHYSENNGGGHESRLSQPKRNYISLLKKGRRRNFSRSVESTTESMN